MTTHQPYKSIIEAPTSDELPPFVVITGANGAGKTHLLESLLEYKTQLDLNYSRHPAKMMTSTQFQEVGHLDAGVETREQKIANLHAGVSGQASALRGRPDATQLIHDFVINNGLLSQRALSAAEAASAKSIGDWTEADYSRFTPLETGRRDLFAVLVADVFFNYVALHTMNGYQRWRAEQFGEASDWIDEAAFAARFGDPPWDALNNVLADIGLPYRYEAPSPTIVPPFPPVRLLDEVSGIEIAPVQLSSGEKTLLLIALSAYSAVSRSSSIEIPSIILLDEPDATLHPSMARSLLNLVQRGIVDGLGIPVIMTTHSPTTVALAPESAIYVMRRNEQPRLVKASKDEALKTLLVGVPTLSVSTENRRTVFVESPADERLYTLAQTLLNAQLPSERSLQFTAAGSRDLPNGCDAVVRLVTKLRSNGNERVWGLVDRDYRDAEPHEFVLHNPELHSIENLILGPLAVGLLLLRDGNEEIRLRLDPTTYVTANFTASADLVDFMSAQVLEPGERDDLATVHFLGGSLNMPAAWSEIRGHDLEARILERFHTLRQHRGHLLVDVIQFVWAEHSWAIPQSIMSTFTRLLRD